MPFMQHMYSMFEFIVAEDMSDNHTLTFLDTNFNAFNGTPVYQLFLFKEVKQKTFLLSYCKHMLND